MADIDPDSIPFLLGKQDAVSDKEGKPTTVFLDWLQGVWGWMKRSVVDLTTRITTVQDETDNAHARITEEIIARVDGDEALASKITTIEVAVGDNTAAIVQEATARANADEAIASLITTLTAEVDGNTAAITAEATARADGDSALASLITSLNAEVDGNTAAISAETTARVDGDAALASQITSLSASFDGFTASGEIRFALKAGPTGTTAAYGLYLTAGSAYAGFEVLALSGGGSAIGLTADKFLFTDAGTALPVFSYSGGSWYLTANVQIDGDLVVNGTVTATKIVSNSLSISQNGSYSVDTHATGSPNTVIGVGGGTWSDYASVSVTPANDARVEIKWEAENIVTTSGGGSIAVHEVRLVRRKGGDTQIGRSYTVSAGNGGGAVDRYFPTVRDEPGTGAVTYVIQHRMNTGSPGAGGYTGRCLYGSITILVSEK